MALITDTIASALGLSSSSSWEWRDHINEASFRGVPFGVLSADATYGRQVAIHEYPYRDSVWVEDLGRSARRFTLRGFLVQDSLAYQAGDVFSQRDNLIAACETSGSGLLVHPTLGELTVYVPDGGLRIEESVDSERVFVFSLAFVEAGDRAFSIVHSASTSATESWYKTLTTTASVAIATITGEMNSISGAIRTIRSTVSAWKNVLDNTVNSATNLVSTVSSLFCSPSYSRYAYGNGSDTASGSTGTVDTSGTLVTVVSGEDEKDSMAVIQASVVNDRNNLEEAIASLDETTTVADTVNAVQNIITAIVDASGSDEEKIRITTEMAATTDKSYHTGATNAGIAATTEAYIRAVTAGALLMLLMKYTPRDVEEAQSMMDRTAGVVTEVMNLLASRKDDESYNALDAQYTAFVERWRDAYLSSPDYVQVTTRSPLPSLLLAQRLYQDASRSGVLVRAASPVHPAFMPVSFKARRT